MRRTKPVVAVLTATITVAAVVTAAPGGAAPAGAASASAVVRLPAPTGPYRIGETQQRLVDTTRRDPWVPTAGARELMVSVWYPAHTVAGHARVPQMLPKAAAHFGDNAAVTNYSVPTGTVDWAATLTDAYQDAPAAPGRRPVVLYSAGLGDPRTFDTTAVEDLASLGYVVVTVDHTYESSEVLFPDGRLLDNTPVLRAFHTATDPIAVLRKIMAVRVADTRFVLDQITSGLITLAGSMDRGDIGMFGHSGGGFEALETMRQDPRIRAAADLDGIVGFDEDDQGPGLSTLANTGLHRPFLLMGSSVNDHYTSTSWAALWRHSSGWKRDVHMTGGKHASFTDAEPILSQVLDRLPADARAEIGWIPPAEAVGAQRHYISAFFDRWLRGTPTSTFDRPDPRWPHLTTVA